VRKRDKSQIVPTFLVRDLKLNSTLLLFLTITLILGKSGGSFVLYYLKVFR